MKFLSGPIPYGFFSFLAIPRHFKQSTASACDWMLKVHSMASNYHDTITAFRQWNWEMRIPLIKTDKSTYTLEAKV